MNYLLPKDKSYWKNKLVVILGGGNTGLACAKVFNYLGANIFLSEKKELSTELKQELDRLSVPYEEGTHSLDKLVNANYIIISPGIPLDAIPLKEIKEKNIPILSEIEMAYRLNPSPLISITGSNGKTTTTSLTYFILSKTDLKVCCGGNIGTPLISFFNDIYDYIVSEISSFQLETIEYFKPKIGALLNLYDNHLDRHKTWQNYRDIKKRLFLNQDINDYAILNADDIRSKGILPDIKSKIIYFSLKQELKEGVFLKDKKIVIRLNDREQIIDTRIIKLKGEHNLENCLAATLICLLANTDIEIIKHGLSEFKGVEHRIEEVRTINGVTFINDSKGTNYSATIKAIDSFTDPLILIAGGRDKGGDFAPLLDKIKSRVKYVILIGEAATDFATRFKKNNYLNFEIVESLEEAVKRSQKIAQSGDIVLFSPACTSYDMFKNFEQRGEYFKKYVNAL